jgi:hypothetical protein
MAIRNLVSIFWVPGGPNGQQLVWSQGSTQSFPTYSAGYYQATMPELGIGSSGSYYTDALSNILAILTGTVSNTGMPPFSNDIGKIL